jgi:hypothetical protein
MSVIRLKPDGELSLDADLSDQSSDHGGGNTGREENGREDDDSDTCVRPR